MSAPVAYNQRSFPTTPTRLPIPPTPIKDLGPCSWDANLGCWQFSLKVVEGRTITDPEKLRRVNEHLLDQSRRMHAAFFQDGRS